MSDRLTIQQVCDELECSRQTVYRLMQSGQLGYVQVTPQKRQVRRSQLDNYLNLNAVAGKGDPLGLPPVRLEPKGDSRDGLRRAGQQAGVN